MRTSRPLLCAAALAVLSCSRGGTDGPRPASVDPASGVASAPVRVTIHGDGFLALPSSQQGGGGAAVDTRHRAWLGDAELEAVTWVDVHTLQATVPAGLPAGPQRLVIENALGRRGSLEDAFTVIVSQSAVLEATLAAAPGSVVVGQPITVTLSVHNAGGAAATAVAPDALSLGGEGAAGAALEGPSPASVDRLEPGASADFTWSVTPAVPGPLTFSSRAQGVDALESSDVVSLAAESSASAQAPAQLTATIAASRATVNVGQAVTATFTLTNGGAAAANVTAISPSRSGTASATCGAPSPAPAPLPSGGSTTFTWTCTATTAGTLSMTATATGTDAISGGTLSAIPASPATVTVQSPAALTASLAVQGNPTTVLVGQVLSVTLTVNDTGQAGASLTTVQPSPTNGCTAPSPALPQSLAGLGSRTFTWSCTVQAAGALSLGASVTGTDVNSGTPVQATAPGISLTALVPAALTATVVTSRGTVSTGQAVTVTFTLTNGGTSTANVTGISRTTTGTAAASTTCTAPTPNPTSAAPASIAAGSSATFTWSCTPQTAGTLSLSGTATGTDAVSGAPLSATPTTPAAVTVQTAAALIASLAVQGNPTTVLVGQVLSVSLTVSDAGQAGATLTAVAPSPANGCSTPSPTLPQSLAGLGSRTFTWSCTVQAAGALSLGASVTGTDVNSGTPVQATAPNVSLTALVPAALTATVVASRSTVSTGQAVTVSFTLTNGGSSTANVTAITRSTTGTAASGTTCTSPSPTPTISAPVSIAAGSSVIFTWSCTSQVAGTLSLTGTATGTDAVSGATVTATPTTPAAVTVQTAASLAVTAFSATRTVADVNQAVQVSLTLANSGQAAASLSSLLTSFSPTGGGSCTAASPLPPQNIPGAGVLTLTWSCTGSAAGSASLDAIITATDANSGLAVAPTVAPLPLTVQLPALLSATIVAVPTTVSPGQPATLTLTVANTGGASATGVSVAPQVTGTASAGASCSAVTPATPQTIAGGGSVTFGWTCQTPTAGTLALNAAVTGSDANTSAPLQTSAETGATVTVIAPGSFTVSSFTSSRATAAIDQPVTVTLTLTNGGSPPADVTSVSPTMTPAATPGCVLATPTTPLTIPSGGSQAFTWTCSSTTPGAFALGATVDATPALAAAPSPIPLAVQSPAVIPPASLHAGAATLNVAQAMTVSVQLANTGQADATVSALALSATGTGAVTCGASPTPAPPQTIAGGTSVTFSWTCTGSTAGPVTLSATAAISDANTGVDVSPAISSVSVAVQTPASLTATLGATVGGLPLSSPVTVGTAVTLTLSLRDPAGHATARVNTVTATKTGNVTCSTPAPVPQDVPGGDTPGIVTWTCTPNNKSNANGFSLGATVTAIDLNTGNPVPAPAVPPISLIVN